MRRLLLSALALAAACDSSPNLDDVADGAPAPDAGAVPLLARAPDDGVLSDEVDIDSPVPVALPLEQAEVIVFTGEHHVALWRESGVRAARIAPDGTVVDEIGVRVGGNVVDLHAVFTGEHILALTRRTESGQDVIEVMRISLDLDPDATVVTELARDDSLLGVPRIAFGDGVALATWAFVGTGGDTRRDIILQRLTPEGAPLGEPASLTPSGTADFLPDVVFDGSQFVVAWERHEDPIRVLATRVTIAGDVIDGGGVTLATTIGFPRPRLAAGGGQLIVSWREDAVLRARRFTPSMAVLDATPIDIDTTADSLSSVDVEFSAGRFGIGWRHSEPGTDNDAIMFRGVGLDGIASPAVVVDGTGSVGVPVELSSDGVLMMLVWRGLVARIGPDDEVLDPGGFSFAHRANVETFATVAGGDGRYLVAWRDDRDGGQTVFARVFDEAGAPVSDALRLSGEDVPAQVPRATFGNGQFGVAWLANFGAESQGLRAVRISTDGIVLDDAPLEIVPLSGDMGADFDLAIGPAGALAVWDQKGASSDVFGRLIASDGALGPAFPISAAAGVQRNPQIVSVGDEFFVAWQDTRESPSGIFGARVRADGSVRDPLGLRLTNSAPLSDMALARVGDHYVLAWDRSISGVRRIFTTAVSVAGEASAPDGIEVVADAEEPHLTADGDGLVAMWREHTADRTIAAMRLSPTGAATATDGFTVEDRQGSFGVAAIASAAPGQAFVVFDLPETATGVGGQQIRGRILTLLDDGAACADGAACGTGFCVDGVCCESACGDGAANDCQACSVAASTAADGVCGPVASGTVCRGAAGQCDVAEVCDGEAFDCPADDPAEDGTTCDDGDGCTDGDSCTSGACAGTAVACAPPAECQAAGVCTGDPDACEYEPLPDGTPCEGGACEDGTCVGTPDAGVPDAGVPDAGAPDAGAPDAGAPDAGAPDAGFEDDAGLPPEPQPDAGVPPSETDAGVTPPTPPAPVDDEGCGCAAGGDNDRGGATLALFVGVALVFTRRRR